MDSSSFEQMYRDMLPGFYRLAQSMLRNAADAQDAVQQAALRAWQAADSMRPGSERAYFTRIVVNECRNIQRRRMRALPVAEFREEGYEPPDRELRMAIDGLPERLRLPLLLKYMEGYTEKEAARALQISRAALKGRLYRARRELEKELKQEVEWI